MQIISGNYIFINITMGMGMGTKHVGMGWRWDVSSSPCYSLAQKCQSCQTGRPRYIDTDGCMMQEIRDSITIITISPIYVQSGGVC